MKTIKLLTDFVNKKPSLDFADYGDIRIYRQESREITADRRDYFELLNFALIEVQELDQKLETYLSNSSERLTLEGGKLHYCVGQYFPTEYRPAASRALRSIIWRHIADVVFPEYDGHELRKYFKRNLSRRVFKNYFN